MFLQPLSDPRQTMVRLSDLVDARNRAWAAYNDSQFKLDCFLAAIQLKNKEAICRNLGKAEPPRDKLPEPVKRALSGLEGKH